MSDLFQANSSLHCLNSRFIPDSCQSGIATARLAQCRVSGHRGQSTIRSKIGTATSSRYLDQRTPLRSAECITHQQAVELWTGIELHFVMRGWAMGILLARGLRRGCLSALPHTEASNLGILITLQAVLVKVNLNRTRGRLRVLTFILPAIVFAQPNASSTNLRFGCSGIAIATKLNSAGRTVRSQWRADRSR